MSSAPFIHGSHASSNTFIDGPRLLADIGGTNARFALERAAGQIDSIRTLRCADHAEFPLAVKAYLADNAHPAIRHAAIAIANPVEGDEIRMTNHHWTFSIEETRRLLGFDTLLVVNDFTALSMALPHLERSHCVQVGAGRALENSVIGLVGAGTGLGIGGLIPGEGRWIALGSEGGHVSFSPSDEKEAAILQYSWRTWRHVSAERLISGPGLEMIYRALCDINKVQHPQELTAPHIVDRALRQNDPLCLEVVACFCGMLGTLTANVAVTLGALGGMYIGGGVVPHLGDYFVRSSFRTRFESKGRFEAYIRKIPTYVITAPYPAFVGVAAILAERLGGSNIVPFLERIRKARPQFSPAEERVAGLILAHPRTVMGEPISEIARRAKVSQPTVIRFCRTMGCQGLADFKLKLASGVTGAVPVAHSQVRVGDSALDLGVKVANNTIVAMMEVRDSLNADTLSKVIDVLSHATRVEFYGFGSCGMVAEDAQQKFVRLGIASTACTDPQWQEVSASLLGNTDVAVIISSSGSLRHLAVTVEVAVNSGATIIALAPGNSPLARRADHTLAVEHDEDNMMHIPMLSRILLLLLVDVLAVGVSLNRSGMFAELQRQARRGILTHVAAPHEMLGDKVPAADERPSGKPDPVPHIGDMSSA